MTWIVPFVAPMSVLTTFVVRLRKTVLPATRIAIVGPASVFADLSVTMREAGTLPFTTW